MPDRASRRPNRDEPDYSALEPFIENLEEYNRKSQEAKDMSTSSVVDAQGVMLYKGTESSERMAKTELINQSGLVKFINKRCRENATGAEETELFKKDNFQASSQNDGYIRTHLSYPPIDVHGELSSHFLPELGRLRSGLKGIGVPEECIERAVYYDFVHDHDHKQVGNDKQPMQYLRVSPNREVLIGIVEKAVIDSKEITKVKQNAVRRKAIKEILGGLGKEHGGGHEVV
jgi:hypothetical protein